MCMVPFDGVFIEKMQKIEAVFKKKKTKNN